jgi:transglutaminase-like putative cysteine protease
MTRPVRARLVALVAVLLAATTFFPLVEGVVWLAELVVVLLLGAIAATVAHRALGETAGAVAGLVAAVLGLTWVFALPEAFLGILPGTDTVARFADLFAQGGETITTSMAPADATPGLRLIVVAGLALVWWTVDLVAVVLRRPAVAGLALLAVYCVPTALVLSGLPWWWFVLAAAGYLVLVASDAQERVARWGRVVGSSGSPGEVEERASLSATGRRVGALAIAAAVVVPALVPGLSESLLPSGNLPGNGPGDGTIAVLNPILSLRDDLTANDDVTVLEYETDDPSPDPLRLVTVDSFDGETWEPTYGDIDRDQRAAGQFPSPPGLSPVAGATTARTSLQIQGLRQGWLPTPYPPTRIDILGNWLYDETTLNVVGDDVETTEGLRYSVQHLMVEPDPEVLAAAGPAPADIVARWTALPAGTPETIGATARTVAGEGTELDQATRLQSWFRSGGGFSYSLDAPPQNGSSAVADFLERRSGYCVHFASAMALMARSLGIPARVAVGWLPGEQLDDGSYRVSQRDAHAWPELYFEGAGWMRFEPTPATRAGTVPGWAAPTAPEPSAAPTTAAPSTSASAAAPTAVREAEGGETTTDRDLMTVLRAIPWRVVLAVLLVLALLAAPAVTAVVVRRRRWVRATTPGERAEVAWTTLLEELGDRGVVVPPALTVRQATAVVGDRLDEGATTSLLRVGRAVERQRYAPPPGTAVPRRSAAGREGGVAVLDLDTATAAPADPLSDRGLRHDVKVVVKAVGDKRPAADTWRARLAPRSGAAHLRGYLQRLGLAADRLDRRVTARFTRRRRG